MTIQTLVAAVKQNISELPATMNLETDSIIINQCDQNSYVNFDYNGNSISVYNFAERGVGLSRNNALLRAYADIVLFSDEDIVYDKGYAEKILSAFAEMKDADMLLFNVDVIKERATYHTDKLKRIRLYNCGRYPAYSFACKREELIKRNITYSLLFGGGARYSNGEDSLFIQECIKKGMKVYALPVKIGREEARPSTWFNGYNEKFFYDRGVLYRYMYGSLAGVMTLRFLIRQRGKAFDSISFSAAKKLMKKGMKEAGI